ncbi:hypothetical protein ACFQUU_25485 [Herbaspirillum sp. GCM10030257]|uniref:glucosamine inositolphosphorylceramide transferase family protein n=1 Tax=Herbaspirillum sp. GCM10030257 TaxID=3273393 RepID=UPI0036094302
MNQIRIGLLIDDMAMPAWIGRMLEHIIKEPGLSIALIVRNLAAQKMRHPSLAWPTAAKDDMFLYNLWVSADARRFAASRTAARKVDLSSMLVGIPVLDVMSKQEDGQDEFFAVDTTKIMQYRLDVLLQLGFGDLRGDILQAAACGVWAYRYGDADADPRVFPGTWEVLLGKAVTESTLEILAAESRQSIVLYRSCSPTDSISPARGVDRMAWKITAFVPRRLRELRQLGNTAFLEKYRQAQSFVISDSDIPNSCPDNLTVARLLCRRVLQKLTTRLRNRNSFEQWTLLYRIGNTDHLTPVRAYKQLIPPKDRFWADPCTVLHEGKHAVFIEECDYASDIGYISAIQFDEHEEPVLPPVKILEKPYHLSYPFIFEDDGTLYMIPESAHANVISLYRCQQFPHEWVFVMNLMEDVIAYDTTIWRHNNKYWLFTTVCDDREASSWDELSLYFSDTLLSTDWKPHPCNPIVSDVRCARSAGRIYERDGKWYRPAQDCSRRYGGAIALRQIETIDEKSYKEAPAGRIEVTPNDGIIGTHTFSQAGRLTCIDGIVRRRKAPMGKVKYAAFAHPFLSTARWLSLRNRS